MYANSDFYKISRVGAPEGELIPAGECERYLKKAGVYLDYLFAGRTPGEPYSDALKEACCEIADIFYKADRRAGISSETNDGYSVTFESGADADARQRAYEAAVRYLGATGLMYRGADVGF